MSRIRELFRTHPGVSWGLVLLVALGLGYAGIRTLTPPAPPLREPARPAEGQAPPAAPLPQAPAKAAPIPSLQGAGRPDPFQPLVVEKPAGQPRRPALAPPAAPVVPAVPPLPLPPPSVPPPPPTQQPATVPQQPAAPPPQPAPAQGPSFPQLVITGILSNARPLAIVRAGGTTSIVAEGEEVIPGVKVVRIEPEAGRVVVEVNGRSVEVRLGGD